MDRRSRAKIRKDFPQSQWQKVEARLERYGGRPGHREVPRVRYDVLVLADGDLKKVSDYVAAAQIDYRDVLYWAEYEATDPWAMWKKLLERFEEQRYLTATEADGLDREAGFHRGRSVAALEALCAMLAKKGTFLSKDEFERIRAFGLRWKTKAIWKPLRKQIRK